MNKMIHKVLKVSVLAGLMAVVLAVVAHPKGDEGAGMCPHMDMAMGMEHNHKHQDRMVERISDALVLDANQKLRLTTLAQKWQVFREAERASTKDKDPRQTLLSLMAGDHLDQKAAQAMAEARAQTLQTQSPEVIKAAADFFDNLRPEQQQKVRKFLAHSPRMGGSGMGGMPHHGGGDHPEIAEHSGR